MQILKETTYTHTHPGNFKKNDSIINTETTLRPSLQSPTRITKIMVILFKTDLN